jgi:hypothetical protein
MGGLGTVRKTMAKAAKRLRDWMAVRKRKGHDDNGADNEVDDADGKRRSRSGSVGGVLIQLHRATKVVGSGARRLSKAVVDGVKDGVTVDDVRRTSRRVSSAVADGVKEGVRRISRRPKPVVPIDPRERRRARTRAAVKHYFSGGWQTALKGGEGADAAKNARTRQNPAHAASTSWQLAVVSEEPEQQKTAVEPDLFTMGIAPRDVAQGVAVPVLPNLCMLCKQRRGDCECLRRVKVKGPKVGVGLDEEGRTVFTVQGLNLEPGPLPALAPLPRATRATRLLLPPINPTK